MMGEEALEYEEIINKLNGLKQEEIKEVIDFIGYLKAKKKRQRLLEESNEENIVSFFGAMKGPSDLADQHDHYLYGWEKE